MPKPGIKVHDASVIVKYHVSTRLVKFTMFYITYFLFIQTSFTKNGFAIVLLFALANPNVFWADIVIRRVLATM